MSRYRKALVALIPFIAAALNVIYDALSDNAISTQEWVAVAIAALTPALVYQVPNKRQDDRGSVGSDTLVGLAIVVAIVLAIVILVQT